MFMLDSFSQFPRRVIVSEKTPGEYIINKIQIKDCPALGLIEILCKSVNEKGTKLIGN